MVHGLSCSVACGIFPDQGSNPCPLHWQADSQPLRHQGSLRSIYLEDDLGLFPNCHLTAERVYVTHFQGTGPENLHTLKTLQLLAPWVLLLRWDGTSDMMQPAKRKNGTGKLTQNKFFQQPASPSWSTLLFTPQISNNFLGTY